MAAAIASTRARVGSMLVGVGVMMTVLAVVLAVSAAPAFAVDKTTTFWFLFYHPTDASTTFISGSVLNSQDAFLANAGGTDHTSPTGMTIHVSCSDEFTTVGTIEGFIGPYTYSDGDGGPDPDTDRDWQVQSYYIEKTFSNGATPEPCGDPNTTTTTTTSTTTTTTTTTLPPTTTTTTSTLPPTTTTSTTTTSTLPPSTTAPTTTTTTVPPTTSTLPPSTTAPTTTTVPSTTTSTLPPELPRTGGGGNAFVILLGGMGLALMGAGFLVIADERRRLMVI